MYCLQLMNKYAANWSVLLIAISECILVAWIYGADRFLDDVQQMIGPRGRVWRFFWTWMWKVVTPSALFFILFFNWVEYEPLKYGNYVYPKWADAIGWFVGILPVLVIVGLTVLSFFYQFFFFFSLLFYLFFFTNGHSRVTFNCDSIETFEIKKIINLLQCRTNFEFN